LWFLFALLDPDLAVLNQLGSKRIWIHNTGYSNNVKEKKEKDSTFRVTANSYPDPDSLRSYSSDLVDTKHQFLAPPEKVMLMPEELRPRVANDVFFSRSMASSSILVGPPHRLT
jgi:hypothetical protein